MDIDKLLQKYLDGELSPAEEREALHLFADDPQMRQILRFEQKVQRSFRDESNKVPDWVPPGFTDRVMHTIAERQTAKQSSHAREIVMSWIRWIWQPRPVQWRPAYAVVMVLLLAVMISFPYDEQESAAIQTMMPVNNSVQPVSETEEKVWLRFVFIDQGAESVEVAGDFSNWEPIALSKQVVNGEHVWTGLISMERGEHRYMFVRNGKEWVTDPLAPVQREDGFGNKNAVIYL